jgi:hypothetical protein
MDERTLAALDDSIAHHERCLAEDDPNEILLGPHQCALCRLFYRDECTGCPVRAQTGQDECEDSPYYEAHHAWSDWWLEPGSSDLKDAYRAKEQIEIDFLKSLRPKPTE